MSRKEEAYIFVGLIVAVLGCVATWLAVPQVQSFISIPSPTPFESTPTQGALKVIQSILTKEQHNDSDFWQESTLAANIEIPGAFEMKLDMEGVGANLIILTSADNRMEIDCEEGTLGVFLRNRIESGIAFNNNGNRPAIPIYNGVTICQITVKFDQHAQHIEIFQNNMLIFQLTPEEVGDFPGGLFPNGKILHVYLTSGPRSGSSISGIKISSVKLNELIFYVPPDQ